MALECQTLRSEANKAKVRSAAPLLDVPSTPPPRSFASLQSNGPLSPPRPQTTAPTSPSSSDPRSRATSPTSPTPYSRAPAVHSPLTARMAASTPLHTRSASVQPSAISRSITPAVRSSTPASPVRPELRSRRMSVSTPSPLKMVRSTSSGSSSDEIQIQKDSHKESERQKAEKDIKRVQLIQRWIPNFEASSPPTGMLGTHFIPPSAPRSPPPVPVTRSRTISAAQAAQAIPRMYTPLRYKTPVSATPS